MPERIEREADWVTVQAAVERILRRVAPLPPEPVPLESALGRTLAETITSPIEQPPWDNSGMDGYAVRAQDVARALPGAPIELKVIESVPAGSFAQRTVEAGEAIKVMTGAPIPDGADGVIRIEHTEVIAPDRIRVLKAADAGRNVRPRGEDVRRGEVVLRPGRVLRAGEIGVLATVGHASVLVHRRPRVALLATGDELVDLHGFDEVVAGRRIINSNSPALAAAVLATGALPELLGIAADDADSLRTHAAAGLAADVLITTAGASVGEHDLVKDVLEQMGLELEFWRVQMRPGSPFSFGLIPRPDRDPLLVFNLPGNPVSALVTFEVLARPALRRMLGRTALFNRTIRALAAERMTSKKGLVHFLRVTLERDGAGLQHARLTGAQGSGLLTSMARADGLLVVPLGVAGIEAGTELPVILLSPMDEGQEDLGY